MIIMGNAELLSSHSEMWRTVIDDLRAARRVGPGLPISCYNHPDYVKSVTEPELIPLVSPDGESSYFFLLLKANRTLGGCLRPCSKRLDCGHSCPSKVQFGSGQPLHMDTECHVFISSVMRMIMPRCVAMNVVERSALKDILVTSNAGNLVGTVNGRLLKWSCRVATPKITSPGRSIGLVGLSPSDALISHISTRLEEVYCSVVVTRPLPDCEHSATMACSEEPNQVRCMQVCNTERTCCSKRCPARCWECKVLSKDPQLPPMGRITRTEHVRHPCNRDLFCQHTCKQPCADGHVCDDCTSDCRQSCAHHRCERGCSTPCTPCAEPCPWSCPHESCPVPCGSVRLPH